MKLLQPSPADTREGRKRIKLINAYRQACIDAKKNPDSKALRTARTAAKRVLYTMVARCTVCGEPMEPYKWGSCACSGKCHERRMNSRKLTGCPPGRPKAG